MHSFAFDDYHLENDQTTTTSQSLGATASKIQGRGDRLQALGDVRPSQPIYHAGWLNDLTSTTPPQVEH